MAETAKQLFDELKLVGDALVSLAPRISKSNSGEAATLLNKLLHLLQDVKEPETIITNANITVIIIPLLSIYKSMTVKERGGFEVVIEPWLEIMHLLLAKTLIKNSMEPRFTIELMVLFATVMDQTSSPTGISKVATSSEEIKHLAVKCLSVALPTLNKETGMLTNANLGLSRAMHQESFIITASQIITALLNIIRLQQNLQLRLDAIQVLSQLLHTNIQDVDKLAQLMPGIVSKLCATLTQKSENTNHRLLCSLLDAIGDLIQNVMRDDMNHTLVEITTFEDILVEYSGSKQQEPQSETVKGLRNKEWYSNSKKKLHSMLGQILQLRLYPDWRTRLAFVEFSYKLLSACSRTLDNCTKPLLEILVLHADDPYTQVSFACSLHMQALLSSPSFGKAIMPSLKEDLYEWIMKFPQYIISKDEQEKSMAMSLIAGMITLLGDQAQSVLSLVLSRASDGWMTALEIDKHSLDILEMKQSERFIELGGPAATSGGATPLYPRIRFKHIATDMSMAKLSRLLNIIGKYCDLSSWVHHFMRYISMDSRQANDPQAAYIVHSLLSAYFSSGSSAADAADEWIVDDDADDTTQIKKLRFKNIAAQVLNDTMDILTDAASTNTTSTALAAISATSLDDESGHVLTVCFGLQLVGLAACIVDQDYLLEQFITILYPLLAHLGSSNVYIHTYALITLDAIAVVCGLGGAKELVIQNIDYIINSISQHISILTDNARVPLVLKALIHVGGYASIDYMDDTVQEIYYALEQHSLNDWLCHQLCSVLFEIVQILEKNVPPTTGTAAATTFSKPNMPKPDTISSEILSFIQEENESVDEEFKSMEEIGKYFLDRQEKGLHEDLSLDQIMEQGNLPMDPPKSDDEPGEDESDDKPIPLTHEQQMTKEIMDKVSHFLTAASPKSRSQVLSLLTCGVSILASHSSEMNQLVHTMWLSIVNRFNDSETYVVLQAATLVEKVSQVSTDFLSTKFASDLWPKFKLLLQRGVSAAESDPLSTGYSIYSVYHRTQLCLLNTLSRIAHNVPMRQELIKDILETARYYYKNEQVNRELDQACQGLFEGLATQQPDTVWLYQQQHDAPLIPPNAKLLDVFQVPEWMSYSNNSNSSSKPKTVQFK
ncbi:armadillo-type protein [Parasitella parasitica]|nr:armadillo-type protein [Parasitella parasitica]